MTKKVYLVDDDQDVIAQNQLVLEQAGYTVVTANSAKDGLKLVEEQGTPDLMVLDVMMEYTNAGLELAKKFAITKEIKQFPIILLTSDTKNPGWMKQDEPTWKFIAKYLDKPFAPKDLTKVVEEILENVK